MLEWEGLLVSLEGVMLEAGRDVMYWKIGKNGKYLTKSLYQELTFRRVKDQRMMELWKIPTPLKILFFAWLVHRGRIQVAQCLKKMNWPGDEKCKLCGETELLSI